MRTADELINDADDAWGLLLEWRDAASRQVEIVAADPAAGRATLQALQVTTRSPMGALALRSGGLVVDQGWLRVLGASSATIGGGLQEWNEGLGGVPLDPPLEGALIVAYDVLGGFFALNGGLWDVDAGALHYLAPDTYDWQSFDLGYSDFLIWAMSGPLDRFYDGQRWSGWQREVATVGPDMAIAIYPPLGFDDLAIGARSRRPVPARELWTLHHDIGRQLALDPTGASVTFRIE